MKMNKRDKLKILLEKAEERLIKENQKTALVLTLYTSIVYGAIVYIKCPGNILDIIIESVVMGIIITIVGIGVWSCYTGLYTNKELLEKDIMRLKIEIKLIDKEEYPDDFMDD